MARVIIIAEGQTEEKFVKSLIFPYFHNKKLFDISVSILPSKITASGKRFKGGNIKSDKVLKFAKQYLNSASVTTFIDYYGINPEFIGYQDSLSLPSISEKKECIENALKEELTDYRFFPYVQMYEFEGLLFSDVDNFIWIEEDIDKINILKQDIKTFPTPEHINNSKITAPSKRIEKIFPSYGKTSDGIIVAEAIGIKTILSKCNHFKDWIEKIEIELRK